MKTYKKLSSNIILQVALIIWLITQLYPIIWMFYSAFKTTSDIIAKPWSLPQKLYLENFIVAWSSGTHGYSIVLFFRNSVIITLVTLIFLAFIPSLAAYSLAKMKFPGRNVAIALLLSLISIPMHSIIIPLFYLLDNLDLINSYVGLVLVYTAVNIPFSVLLLQSYFKSFPDELIEAGKVDGCSEILIYSKIVFPMAHGAISTTLIVAFLNVWNEFLLALIVMKKNSMKTLPVGINIFRGQYGTEWGPLLAALVSASIVSLIFYFIFQNKLVSGMAVGAVKE